LVETVEGKTYQYQFYYRPISTTNIERKEKEQLLHPLLYLYVGRQSTIFLEKNEKLIKNWKNSVFRPILRIF